MRFNFIVEENSHIIGYRELPKQNDLMGFGQNMYKSHNCLSEDYEVNSRGADFLQEMAPTSATVIGIRIMGRKPSGDTINFVKVVQIDAFIKYMLEACNA